jgi:spore coat polysaccharide biosynthesis protein SpsF
LAWVVRAAAAGGFGGRTVIATTTHASDDPVAALATELGCAVVRGPDDDVLARFDVAATSHDGDPVVRLTADCPLLDPGVIRMAVGAFIHGDVDYLSTVSPRTLPRGLDVEVLSASVLQRLHRIARSVDRVHVTSHIHRYPEQFTTAGLTFQPDTSDLRVTLDTELDARLLEEVVAALGARAQSRAALVGLLRDRPDLAAMNAEVIQKGVDEG